MIKSKKSVSMSDKLKIHREINLLHGELSRFELLNDIFDTNYLTVSKLWESFFKRNDEYINLKLTINSDLANWAKQVKGFKDLIGTKSLNHSLLGNEMSSSNGQYLIKTFILPDEDDFQTSPDRLVESLSGISKLYKVAAEVLNVDTNTIFVTRLDSGSDKGYDIKGVKGVVDWVYKIVINIWDRIAYHPEEKSKRKLENAHLSLGLVEKIHQLGESGAISPEKCEIMKRDYLDAMNKLINSGTLTEKMSLDKNQRLLATQEIKLLKSKESDINIEEFDKSED